LFKKIDVADKVENTLQIVKTQCEKV